MNKQIPAVCTHSYVQAPGEMQGSEDGSPQVVKELPSAGEDSAVLNSAGWTETDWSRALCPAAWPAAGRPLISVTTAVVLPVLGSFLPVTCEVRNREQGRGHSESLGGLRCTASPWSVVALVIKSGCGREIKNVSISFFKKEF